MSDGDLIVLPAQTGEYLFDFSAAPVDAVLPAQADASLSPCLYDLQGRPAKGHEAPSLYLTSSGQKVLLH